MELHKGRRATTLVRSTVSAAVILARLVPIAALPALAALLAFSAPAGQSATANPQGIPPFRYEFRVIDFSMTATLTFAKTATTTRYRLEKPSATRSLHYLGPRPANPQSAWKGTFAAPVVDVVAEATYSSPDPSCTKSIEYRPAGNRIVQVFVQLQPPRGALRRVSAGVGRIPLGEPHPGQDGAIDPYGRPKCGKPDFGDWYQDAVAYAPARLLAKPRVTITTHHEEKFSDPGIESLEWTLKVVLQRVGYRKINCATHPGC